MVLLPSDMLALLNHFASLFSRPTWRQVPILVVGLAHLPTLQTYHRVLNRAVCSSLGASRILFGLLVATFAPAGPLVVGIEETIERRRGKQIGASGIYRDPVRSSHSHFVKVRGLRWICAGSAPCCWSPSHGQIGYGPSLSSRCLPPRSATLPGGDGGSSRLQPGRAR